MDSPVKPSHLTLACEMLKSLWLAVLFDFLNCLLSTVILQSKHQDSQETAKACFNISHYTEK